MASLADIRRQYPQYEDLSDQQLADAIYTKFYSDMPREDFNQRLGVGSGERPTVPAGGWWNTQNMSRQFLNSIPVVGPSLQGAYDEGQAQFQSLIHGQPIEQTRQSYDQMNRSFAAADPVGGAGASVAGTVLPLAVAGGAIPAVGKVLGMTGNLPMRMLFGAGSGSILAGADTAARGGNLSDTLTAGATGAVLGGGAPAAFRGLGMLRNAVFPNRQPGPMLNRALRDDNILPEDVPSRLAALGPEATIMDLGPNLQRQAGALASVPGAAQQTIRSAVAARGTPTRVNARIQSDIARTIGRDAPAFEIAENVIQQQRMAAKPLYDAVRYEPIEPTGNILLVLQSQTGKQAFREAFRLALDDGVDIPRDGTLTVGLLDYAKRYLDDLASAATRAGRNNEARIFSQQARWLREAADQQVPAYARAREAFAGPAAVLEALDEGQNVFATGRQQLMHPNQLRSQLEGMSQSERDAFLQGTQSAIQDLLGTARNNPRTVRELFQRGYNAEKLRILIGDESTNDLLRAIDREITFGQTTHVVTGNSETAARQVAQGEVSSEVARSQRPVSVFEAVLRAFDKARGMWAGRSQAANNQQLAVALAGDRIPDPMLRQMYPRPPLPNFSSVAGLLASPQ